MKAFLVRVVLAIFSMLAMLVMCGCEKKQDPVISIQRAMPPGELPLKVGATVAFDVDVRIQGTTEPAEVGLIVQTASGVVLGGCDPVKATNGATVHLTATVVVPETTSIRIFTPLYGLKQAKTEVIDTREYSVTR